MPITLFLYIPFTPNQRALEGFSLLFAWTLSLRRCFSPIRFSVLRRFCGEISGQVKRPWRNLVVFSHSQFFVVIFFFFFISWNRQIIPIFFWFFCLMRTIWLLCFCCLNWSAMLFVHSRFPVPKSVCGLHVWFLV